MDVLRPAAPVLLFSALRRGLDSAAENERTNEADGVAYGPSRRA